MLKIVNVCLFPVSPVRCRAPGVRVCTHHALSPEHLGPKMEEILQLCIFLRLTVIYKTGINVNNASLLVLMEDE